MQETATVITDLRNEEPSHYTEYKTWGDLPDGTAVLDEFGDLFIVNNSNQVAAFSANGNYLMRRDELFTGCTIVQIENQIKKKIRKF